MDSVGGQLAGNVGFYDGMDWQAFAVGYLIPPYNGVGAILQYQGSIIIGGNLPPRTI